MTAALNVSARSPEFSLAALDLALRDPAVCKTLLARLERALGGRPMVFMEVCGTHTVSIFQSGIHSLLPCGITHLSGPGCPVCVTSESEVAMVLGLAALPGIIIATFGDLVRVPGPDGITLKHAISAGADVRIVFSQFDALEIARANPARQVVFLGIGFETTAPGAACTILTAARENINNFLLLSLHKLTPPALAKLLSGSGSIIDAFLLPGHVATVTGLRPFRFLSSAWKKPAIVGGFEPADILLAICRMAEQLRTGSPAIVNAYTRAVNDNGNPRALMLMDEVFETVPAQWRGLGEIAASGFAIRGKYERFDARKVFGLVQPAGRTIPGCKCGEILSGRLSPPDCPLFGQKCSPQNPVGPCMVSSEGACAAYYRYKI